MAHCSTNSSTSAPGSSPGAQPNSWHTMRGAGHQAGAAASPRGAALAALLPPCMLPPLLVALAPAPAPARGEPLGEPRSGEPPLRGERELFSALLLALAAARASEWAASLMGLESSRCMAERVMGELGWAANGSSICTRATVTVT
jgi:hypothetical protein